jgi:hypothetical protein
MLKSDTVCTIKRDGTVNIKTEHGGARISKVVSVEAFASALRSDTEELELPLFPTGLKKYKKSGDYLVVALEYPEALIENVRYNGQTYNMVVPRSVWIHWLSSKNGSTDVYKIQKSWIFALDMPLLSESQNLYKWPMGNWSLDYDKVCWGNHEPYHEIQQNCKLANISSLYSMYFSSDFNDDLGWDLNPPDNSDYNHIPDFLSKQNQFDVSWLIREGSMTFGNAIDMMASGERSRRR